MSGVMFGPQTAQRLLRLANGRPGRFKPALTRKIGNSAPGNSTFRFTLLEDVGGSEEDIYFCDVFAMDLSPLDETAEIVDTYGWMSALQLRAGDRGLCVKDGGTYYFTISDCGSIGDCTDGPFLDAQTPTTATVGDAYTWTPTPSGTNAPDTWGAADLPAGLSVDTDTGEITGTPTEAGEFLVVLTATKDECVATKIVRLTVEASE